VPTENVLVPVTEVLPFSETAPVPVLNVPVPDCRKLPETPRVVNDPVDGVVPPIAILFIVPPVNVALDEEKLLAVVGPFNETAPVPVLNVPDPDCRKLPETPSVVKFPVDGVVPPITMPSIVPPVSVAPDEAKLLAVVAPVNVFVLAPVWV
jgi:hypothetical protein